MVDWVSKLSKPSDIEFTHTCLVITVPSPMCRKQGFAGVVKYATYFQLHFEVNEMKQLQYVTTCELHLLVLLT